jgi:hypothetical protein
MKKKERKQHVVEKEIPPKKKGKEKSRVRIPVLPCAQPPLHSLGD